LVLNKIDLLEGVSKFSELNAKLVRELDLLVENSESFLQDEDVSPQSKQTFKGVL